MASGCDQREAETKGSRGARGGRGEGDARCHLRASIAAGHRALARGGEFARAGEFDSPAWSLELEKLGRKLRPLVTRPAGQQEHKRADEIFGIVSALLGAKYTPPKRRRGRPLKHAHPGEGSAVTVSGFDEFWGAIVRLGHGYRGFAGTHDRRVIRRAIAAAFAELSGGGAMSLDHGPGRSRSFKNEVRYLFVRSAYLDTKEYFDPKKNKTESYDPRKCPWGLLPVRRREWESDEEDEARLVKIMIGAWNWGDLSEPLPLSRRPFRRDRRLTTPTKPIALPLKLSRPYVVNGVSYGPGTVEPSCKHGHYPPCAACQPDRDDDSRDAALEAIVAGGMTASERAQIFGKKAKAGPFRGHNLAFLGSNPLSPRILKELEFREQRFHRALRVLARDLRTAPRSKRRGLWLSDEIARRLVGRAWRLQDDDVKWSIREGRELEKAIVRDW